MGIFNDNVEVVNRTSKKLSVRFDGQEMTLLPNYTAAGERIKGVKNLMPRICIPYARNQNILMGTEDTIDPSAFECVIAIKGGKREEDESFLEQSASLSRVDLAELIGDPNVTIKTAGKKHTAFEAGVGGGDREVFDLAGKK